MTACRSPILYTQTFIAWRFTNISSRSRSTGSSIPALPALPTIATAATIGSVRVYDQLSSNLVGKDKGTSGTKPDDFSSTVDDYKQEDPTNNALDPDALIRTLYSL